VTPYALGPLYTKDAAEARAFFTFAKRFGVKTIVGVPFEWAADGKTRLASRKQLEAIDKLVKEFDIRYAIHNHGPQVAKMFPDVEFGWKLVKDLDPRIGFCLDVGWEFACGKDPAATIRKYGERIYDIHFKDFEIGKPDGASVPLGRGKLDYRSVMQALADIGYTGVCSLEYEKDFDDNLAAVAECAGYFRGVAKCIRPRPKMMPAPANANTLTPAEKAEGWQLLWDGKTGEGWVGVRPEWNKSGFWDSVCGWFGCESETRVFPDRGWVMKDGTLTMCPVKGISEDRTWFPLPPEDQKLGGAGDIVTVRKYRDFVFSFDFRLTRAANSGVK